MTNCPYCGYPIDANTKFCYNCGANLASIKICGTCGAPLDADEVFCSSCGTKYSPPNLCKKCGKPLAGNASFCPACDIPVSAPTTPVSPQSGKVFPDNEDKPSVKHGKSSGFSGSRGIALGVCAVAIVGCLLVFFSRSDLKNRDDSSSHAVDHSSDSSQSYDSYYDLTDDYDLVDDYDDSENYIDYSSSTQESPSNTYYDPQIWFDVANASNSNNSALFCFDGEKIFYRGGTFKESSGSTYGVFMADDYGNVQRVYESANWYTFAKNGLLFFYDHKEDNNLVCVDSDSKEAIYLNMSVDYVVLQQDYLYINRDDVGLYRIDLTETLNPEFMMDREVKSISCYGDSMYYIPKGDSMLYKADLDTSNPVQLSSLGEMRDVVVSPHGIIFMRKDTAEGGRIYLSENEKSYRVLADTICTGFLVDDTSLYYIDSNRGNAIYRYNLETGSVSLVDSDPALYISLVDDWIFYVNTRTDTSASNDSFEIWRVKKNGSERERMS